MAHWCSGRSVLCSARPPSRLRCHGFSERLPLGGGWRVVTSAVMAAVCGRGLLAPLSGRLWAGPRVPLRSVAAAPLYDVVVSGGGMVGSAMAAVLGKAVTFPPAPGGVAGAVGAARCRPRGGGGLRSRPHDRRRSSGLPPLPRWCEVSEVFGPPPPGFVSSASRGFLCPAVLAVSPAPRKTSNWELSQNLRVSVCGVSGTVISRP